MGRGTLMDECTTVAVLQASLDGTLEENVGKIESLVGDAAAAGAQVILAPELFEGPYFPKIEDEQFFELARPFSDHPTIKRMSKLAASLHVVLPVSFFEKDGHQYFNSLAMVDADGSVLGLYRKSHIPDGPGYEEKFYFRPGDTGFRTWSTRYGALGVGICWDQWFPEAAREMALAGAEILLYPTAIGSEPADPDQDTRLPWMRVMQGHAVANCAALAAANRIGDEDGQSFYGNSFLCDHRGEVCESFGATEEGFLSFEVDRAAMRSYRAAFGFFRDRRPELYLRSRS